MILKRKYQCFAAAVLGIFLLFAFLPARADAALTSQQAAEFIQNSGTELVNIIDAPGTAVSKVPAYEKLISQIVDVDSVGKFVLGQFWRMATPAQQQEYLQLFRPLVVYNLTSKLGTFKGSSFSVTGTVEVQPGVFNVTTDINSPTNGSQSVVWVVSDDNGNPKIIDVIVAGTSLRLTEHSSYQNVLLNNNLQIAALLTAMKDQLARLQKIG